MTESATLRNALCALLAAGAAAASSGASSSAPTAVDATLNVCLTAGKPIYAIGELIPLELELRGRAGPDYFFSTATGDRLGLGLERYGVTPAGGSDDPMAELRSSVGVVGSVLSGWHPAVPDADLPGQRRRPGPLSPDPLSPAKDQLVE